MQSKDPMDEGEKRRLVLELVAQLRCVECGQLYDVHDFAFIHRQEELWVLSTRCRQCDEPCHVVVFMELESEQESLTDLTPEELEVADKWLPITADDVLDVHELLCEFDGDFRAFLER